MGILRRLQRFFGLLSEEEKELIQIIEKTRKDGKTLLYLSRRGITKLPPEIGQLTKLTILDLSNNQLSTLPPEIGQQTNLRGLSLRDNQLLSLPPEIGQLTKLDMLNLNRNQFSTLPLEIWKLTNLTQLFLGGNQLSTLPPEIGQLTNLTRLFLGGNQLSTLPPQIGQLTNLTSFEIGDKQLSTLPSEIWQLTNLTELLLYVPQLKTLPPEIWQLTNLTRLRITNNQLSSLLSGICQLTHLTELILSYNALSLLPAEIGQLTNLTALYLNNCQLESLPSEIGQLTNLTELDLKDNQLSTLPSEIRPLINLKKLVLHGNQLPIPSRILERTDEPATIIEYYFRLPLKKRFKTSIEASLYMIEEAMKEGAIQLDLSKKELTRLPPEIGQLSNLTELDLSQNQLQRVEPEIGQLSNLSKLVYSQNQLTTLPPEIGQLTNLTELILEDNQLDTLPPEIRQLTNLKKLVLRGNPLPIPPEILERSDDPATIIEYYFALPPEKRFKTSIEASLYMIEEAMKEEATQLDLSKKGLTRLPSEVGRLNGLTKLSLHTNQLSALPLGIKQLLNLTTLYLHHNQFETLPPEVGLLRSLTTLYLHHNQLETLPPEIGQLSNLTSLFLHRNHLNTLPPEIGQLTNLSKLTLSLNQLKRLPPEIGRLTDLSKLSVSHNQLVTLPSEIGQLRHLTTLDLRDNQLSTLPVMIGQLSNLLTLDLSHNQLSALPLEIRHLTKLTTLDLRFNPLPIPPEILQRIDEPATIIKYYLRVRQAGLPLNEAKVLLVGQGGVGKTSLLKRLVEGKFHKREAMTEGINMKSWGVSINDEVIKLNVWDFGGQEIMHATHQFFLTKRTLYLLVLNARLAEASSRLDYWLNLIESFGGDSPIIVVSNKIDLIPQYRPPALPQDKQDELKKKHPSIKAFVDTSCKREEGLAELEKQIIALVDELEHVRDQLPVEWLAIKAELEGIEQNYIAYREYVELCQANDIRDEQEQRNLIRLLHDLGVLLYFPDDSLLSKTIVLNPDWVTGGVYQIINAKPLQNNGVLTIGELDQILDRSVYLKEHDLLLIEMMRRFERCFDLEGYVGEKFLIPDLLPNQEPSLGFWPIDSLDFEYHYNFLPNSVISRFMVQMHSFIFADNCWLTGMILIKNKNRALVKASPKDKKISISIIGEPEGRAKFLTDIRSAFEQIHQPISNLAVVEHVGHQGQVIPYSVLESLYKQGIKSYHFLADNDELVMVEVDDLLERVRWEPSQQEERAIEPLLEKLRQKLHPELFYVSPLSLGRAHYKVGAYTLARQALAVSHQALRALRGMEHEEESHLKLARESAQLYQMLVHCYLEEANYAKAFEYAAIGKGRAFVNKLAEASFDASALDSQEGFAEKLRQTRQLRDEIKKSRLSMSVNAQDETQKMRGELYKLLQEETELWQEMARQYPVLTATLTVPTLSSEQACHLAKELQATLVEYYRYGPESSPRWGAFVVTADEIKYIPLPKLKTRFLKEMIKWRNNLLLPAGRSSHRHKQLEKLYKAAITPLALQGEHVIIAPFERLHLLPLSAAYNPNTKRYLAQEHILSFVPSLTALHVFNQNPERRALSKQPIKQFLSVAHPGPTDDYLPNVLAEARVIIESVSKMASVKELHEESATPSNVLAFAPNYDVIHFGCHGKFDSLKPTQSGLRLAGKSPYLTVQEIISKLDLKQTRLVTLAACLTGRVALGEGEEHIGLLQAMMTAGVPTVVASLWSVDDTATRALFTAFYTREANINNPTQAMRDAATLLREHEQWKKKWGHPFYWAAFQVNGLTSPAKQTKPSEWPPDLLKQIDEAYQRGIMARKRSINAQLFVDNAKLLLKDMLSGQRTIATLKQYKLPNQIASLRVENSQLGIAEAIHHIVLNHPTLRKTFLPPSKHELKQLSAQLRELRLKHQRTPKSPHAEPAQKGAQLEHEIVMIKQELIEFLKALEDDENEESNQKVWSRFMHIFLPRNGN